MKKFTSILVSVFLVGCVETHQVGVTAPIIDTTSFDSISKSIATAKPEDQQIVGAIPCDLGHKLGLDPSNPKQRELLLEQLRVVFRGKTVAQVAAEVRTQQKSASDKLQKFAEDFVSERQARWKGRAEHISAVTTGTREEDIFKYFGKPNSESGTDTTRILLYWISAYLKDGQICEDFIEFKTERGVVVSFRQNTGYRQDIADVYKKTQKKRGQTIEWFILVDNELGYGRYETSCPANCILNLPKRGQPIEWFILVDNELGCGRYETSCPANCVLNLPVPRITKKGPTKAGKGVNP